MELMIEYYDLIKNHLRSDGSVSEVVWLNFNIKIEHDDYSTGYFRPASLKGLETNNGWIKIESEKDLPESGYYEVVLRSTKETTRGSITHSKPKAMVAYYSHYQPIKEIEKPLY